MLVDKGLAIKAGREGGEEEEEVGLIKHIT